MSAAVKQYIVENPTLYMEGETTWRYEPGMHIMVKASYYEAALSLLRQAREALVIMSRRYWDRGGGDAIAVLASIDKALGEP